ncbi:enoyl-CoA hydratase-related protein [Photobacterium alginatilyticum]|uniref:enoyl-CoA hydratase-related protein n=1 Tax=Photobacterium alginatilyticum TaxID=1775171 RepID=UPI0040695B62
MSQPPYRSNCLNHSNSFKAENLHTEPDADVLCSINETGVATITLNRVNKHNAFDATIIRTLLEYLYQLKAQPTLRALILKANGKHFSAGADLQWMKSMVDKPLEENQADALQLAELLYELDNFSVPSIVYVQGSAFGGALGLICCCDIAIADKTAQFCLSEVKLGLIPATIGPYVCRTIGQRQARRYMLTAERFNVETAHQLNVIHEITTTQEEASELVTTLTSHILGNSPNAMVQVKKLCQLCESHSIDEELINTTSELIAEIRISPEGQEGLKAFFAKRPPAWSIDNE